MSVVFDDLEPVDMMWSFISQMLQSLDLQSLWRRYRAFGQRAGLS